MWCPLEQRPVTPVSSSPHLTILVDGKCPFCRREIDWLKRLDRRDQLQFVDISRPDFDASRFGLADGDVHLVLHGIGPDGQILRGMDTFRQAYAAVGLGWLLAPTGWPILRPLFDALYACFARHRVRLGSLFSRGSSSESCPIDRS